MPHLALDTDSVVEAASQRAGYEHAATLPSDIMGRLNNLVALLDTARLSAFGRFQAAEELAHAIESRLRSDRFLGSFQPHEDPLLLIAGLPRTGTTALHRMLSSVRGLRSVLHWEAMYPSARAELSGNPRRLHEVRLACEARLRLLYGMAPEFKSIHEVGVDDPDECNVMLQRSLMSINYAVRFDVPQYLTSLLESDLSGVYQRHAMELDLVMALDDTEATLVLKSPAHLFDYAAVARAFPQATVVHLARDPAAIIASWCSLVSRLRRVASNQVEPTRLGPEWLSFWTSALDKSMRQVDSGLVPLRFATFEYERLMADPARVISKICDLMEIEVEFDWSSQSSWSSSHRYTLGEYGLTADDVAGSFSSLVQRHVHLGT